MVARLFYVPSRHCAYFSSLLRAFPNLDIVDVKNKGKSLLTKAPVPVNETIFEEVPAAILPTYFPSARRRSIEHSRGEMCSHCLRSLRLTILTKHSKLEVEKLSEEELQTLLDANSELHPSLINPLFCRCSRSCHNVYCSSQCQQQAWQLYHQLESSHRQRTIMLPSTNIHRVTNDVFSTANHATETPKVKFKPYVHLQSAFSAPLPHLPFDTFWWFVYRILCLISSESLTMSTSTLLGEGAKVSQIIRDLSTRVNESCFPDTFSDSHETERMRQIFYQLFSACQTFPHSEATSDSLCVSSDISHLWLTPDGFKKLLTTLKRHLFSVIIQSPLAVISPPRRSLKNKISRIADFQVDVIWSEWDELKTSSNTNTHAKKDVTAASTSLASLMSSRKVRSKFNFETSGTSSIHAVAFFGLATYMNHACKRSPEHNVGILQPLRNSSVSFFALKSVNELCEVKSATNLSLGFELSVSYSDDKEVLMKRYGFECKCWDCRSTSSVLHSEVD